jgi:fumarate reductase flavoprotein subunit
MRRIFSVFGAMCGLALVYAAGSIAGCAMLRGESSPEKAPLLDEYLDGVYEGSAPAYRGPIRLAVRLESGVISEINIIDFRDDEFVGGAAVTELTEQVLEYNTTDLDAVSGATESSSAFLAAIDDALGKAKLEF